MSISTIHRVFIPTSRQVQRFQSSSRSPVNLHFSETISGVSTVRAFGAQDRFTAEFQVGKDYGPYQAVEFITFPLDDDVTPC